jgi:hypothetical protein
MRAISKLQNKHVYRFLYDKIYIYMLKTYMFTYRNTHKEYHRIILFLNNKLKNYRQIHIDNILEHNLHYIMCYFVF